MNATPEEWRSAYEGYRDDARRHGKTEIPSQDEMMATALGRATLQCRVIALRAMRARSQRSASSSLAPTLSAPHRLGRTPPKPVTLDRKRLAAGERDDD